MTMNEVMELKGKLIKELLKKQTTMLETYG